MGQKPLFSEGKTFFTIEPDEQKPGEVKSLGSRIIDCPDFWVFALQQKDGIVLTYLEPHDNTYGLHCVPGRGVRAGRGVAYSWEETGLCSGKIKTEFVQDTVFAGKRCQKARLAWKTEVWKFTARRACSELVKKGRDFILSFCFFLIIIVFSFIYSRVNVIKEKFYGRERAVATSAESWTGN